MRGSPVHHRCMLTAADLELGSSSEDGNAGTEAHAYSMLTQLLNIKPCRHSSCPLLSTQREQCERCLCSPDTNKYNIPLIPHSTTTWQIVRVKTTWANEERFPPSLLLFFSLILAYLSKETLGKARVGASRPPAAPQSRDDIGFQVG